MVGWWCWILTAWAAPVGVLGVSDPTLTPADQAQVSEAMVSAVDALSDATARDPDALGRRVGAMVVDVIAAGAEVSGRRRLQAGRVLMERGRTAKAEVVVLEARTVLEDVARQVPVVGALREALILLATVRTALGDVLGAREALAAAVRLAPESPPAVAEAPVEVRSMWREEAAAVEAFPVLVRSEGAEAWLDGRRVGALPARVSAVPPGVHQVHVVGAGGLGGVSVEVDGPTEVVVPLGPFRIGAPVTDPSVRAARTEGWIRALADATDTPVIVLAGRVDGIPTAQVYVRSQDAYGPPYGVSGEGAEAERYAAAAAAAVAGLQGGRVPEADQVFVPLPLDLAEDHTLARALWHPAAGPVPSPAPVPPPARPRRWPLWLGVGLGVAAAVGTGVAVGVTVGGQSSGNGAPVGTIRVRMP